MIRMLALALLSLLLPWQARADCYVPEQHLTLALALLEDDCGMPNKIYVSPGHIELTPVVVTRNTHIEGHVSETGARPALPPIEASGVTLYLREVRLGETLPDLLTGWAIQQHGGKLYLDGVSLRDSHGDGVIFTGGERFEASELDVQGFHQGFPLRVEAETYQVLGGNFQGNQAGTAIFYGGEGTWQTPYFAANRNFRSEDANLLNRAPDLILVGGQHTITNGTFQFGEGALAGSVGLVEGELTVRDSQFSGSNGVWAGAIGLGPGAALTVEASGFTDTGSGLGAGAIGTGEEGIVSIRGTTFSSTWSDFAAGAVRVGEGGTLWVEDTNFLGTSSGLGAGAVGFLGDEATIRNTAFTGTSGWSGAILQRRGHLQVDGGSSFLGTEGVFGGAILVRGPGGAELTLSDTTFHDTSATWVGGALAVLEPTVDGGPRTQVNLHGLAFDETRAGHSGGAIWIAQGVIDLDDVAMDDPTAAILGGALYLEDVTGSVTDLRISGASVEHLDDGAVVEPGDLDDGEEPPEIDMAEGAGGAIAAWKANVDFFGLQITGAGSGPHALRGAGLAALDSQLGLYDADFRDLYALKEGGGMYLVATELIAEDLRLRDLRAGTDGGGIKHEGGSVNLQRLEGRSLSAKGIGAAIFGEEAGLVLDDALVRDSEASSGGVVVAGGALQIRVRHSRFCDNTVHAEGAVLVVAGRPIDDLVLSNTVFIANTAPAGSFGMIPVSGWPYEGAMRVHNNTFVASSNPITMYVAGHGLELYNNIFHTSGRALHLEPAGLEIEGSHNLWWPAAEVVGTEVLPGEGAVFEDPLFQGSVEDGCEANLWLQSESPARHAGHPDWQNADGSRADIGAFGGPDADPTDPGDPGDDQDPAREAGWLEAGCRCSGVPAPVTLWPLLGLLPLWARRRGALG